MIYLERIRKAFAKVIGEESARAMHEESTMETVKGWDSINFIALVMAVEDEFKITLSTLDAASLISVKDIHRYLEKRLAA
jgi:acyl carrier protein